MTMIEKVARVLAERAGASTCGFRFEEARAYFEQSARAAIEAMRNPPDTALGIHGLMDVNRARHIRVDWERVIDAALRE